MPRSWQVYIYAIHRFILRVEQTWYTISIARVAWSGGTGESVICNDFAITLFFPRAFATCVAICMCRILG